VNLRGELSALIAGVSFELVAAPQTTR
jgi:hypothetical protein